MKRKLYLLFCLLFVIVLAGCGNSTMGTKGKGKTIKPNKELMNSSWSDLKVQIYDMVFTNDGRITDEDIRRIVNSSKYNVELVEDFDRNGNAIIKGISIGDETVLIARTSECPNMFDIFKRSVREDEIGALYDACTIDENCYFIPLNYDEDSYESDIGKLALDGKAYFGPCVEFSDIKTREDLLDYLSANGYVEVEEERDDNEPYEMSYYRCHGVQSITFYRTQLFVTAPQLYYGSDLGAHINYVGTYRVCFNPDGTVEKCSSPIMGNADFSCKLSLVFDNESAENNSVRERKLNNSISADLGYTVGLQLDGTVVATDIYYEYLVKDWRDIVAVAAGTWVTVGLRSDGTVVATTTCEIDERDYGRPCDVEDWRDIVAVAAGFSHTVGLHSDGTVVATGYNAYGQCDVEDWRDIVAIAAGGKRTVGLRSDGTVVLAGSDYGFGDIRNWRDIVAVAAGKGTIVGLRSDGTVVASGSIGVDDCTLPMLRVEDWRDIVAIAAGGMHTVGLHSDGTVVATGIDPTGGSPACLDVEAWRDIVAIAAGYSHTVGLRSDGTVVAIGESDGCYVEEWKDIKVQ